MIKNKLSISNYLILSSISTLTIVFIALVLIVFTSYSSIYKNDVEQKMRYISQNIKNHYDSKITDLKIEIKTIANSRNIEAFNENNSVKLIEEEFLKHQGNFKVLAFKNNNKKIIVKVAMSKVNHNINKIKNSTNMMLFDKSKY